MYDCELQTLCYCSFPLIAQSYLPSDNVMVCNAAKILTTHTLSALL